MLICAIDDPFFVINQLGNPSYAFSCFVSMGFCVQMYILYDNKQMHFSPYNSNNWEA